MGTTLEVTAIRHTKNENRRSVEGTAVLRFTNKEMFDTYDSISELIDRTNISPLWHDLGGGDLRNG